jgi:hypothetical protein
VAFLARANADQAPCVHVAVGPNELMAGRVATQLQDPPPELVIQLKGQGMVVDVTRFRRQPRYAATVRAACCFSKSIGLT